MQVGDHPSSSDKKYWRVQPQLELRAMHSLPIVSLLGSVSKILHSISFSMCPHTNRFSPAARPTRRASQQP